mmetsp:Transcript_60934/g.196333  ORF Transcript_60934/g.196333 Transcript_60934/m.196333 type:complete len:384 (-) Transcript_60934:994-2145(-)
MHGPPARPWANAELHGALGGVVGAARGQHRGDLGRHLPALGVAADVGAAVEPRKHLRFKLRCIRLRPGNLCQGDHLLLHLLHEGPQLPAHVPGLLEQRHDVHALGHALDALEAHDELLDAHLLVVLDVQDVEELPRLEGVELLRGQVGPHVLLLQEVLELLPADLARPVRVGLLEDVPHLAEEGRVALEPALDHKVAVEAAELAGPVHEDAREHVQHADDHEEDVEREYEAVHEGDLAQGPRDLVPVHAAGDALQQGHEGVDERGVPLLDARPHLRGAAPELYVQGRGLHEAYREHIHDGEEQQQRPGDRREGLRDAGNHEPQVVEQPAAAHEPQHARHAQGAEHAQGPEAEAREDLVGDGGEHQDHVEDIPLPVCAEEVLQP